MKSTIKISDYNEEQTLFFVVTVDTKYKDKTLKTIQLLPDLYHGRKKDNRELRMKLGISDDEFNSKDDYDWNDYYNTDTLRDLLLEIPTLDIVYDADIIDKVAIEVEF